MAGERKDPAAVSLGRRGGRARVPKGFSMMDPDRRAGIAKQAAAARWGKKATGIAIKGVPTKALTAAFQKSSAQITAGIVNLSGRCEPSGAVGSHHFSKERGEAASTFKQGRHWHAEGPSKSNEVP